MKLVNPLVPIGRYFRNWIMLADYTLNTAQEGDPQETVSSTLGKGEKRGDPRFFNSVAAGRALVWVLNKIQVNHCYRSIDNNSGSDAVYPQKASKKNA
jgi:hypothetical protein